MIKKLNILFLASILMITQADLEAQQPQIRQIDWQSAAQINDSSGKVSIGFAGPINGVSNGVFITAGGANFPDKMPWEGGKKQYSDEIHLLQPKGDKYEWIQQHQFKLPEAIAYAGNTSTDKGIVFVGGESAAGLSKKAFLLSWNLKSEQVEIKRLPDLPIALTNIAVTQLNKVVFAIGGDESSKSSNTVFSLDLNEANSTWLRRADLPLALANATAIAQQGADGQMQIFVIGGRSKTASGISDLHPTVFAYLPSLDTWVEKANIANGTKQSNLSAAAGVALGTDYILITGGDNGEVFHQIETFIAKISQANSPEEKAKFTQVKNDLVIHHRGFDKSLLLYNTKTNSWSKIGELPFLAPVTTTATKWDDKIILSNGEVKPGIRTPKVMLGIVK